MQKDKLKAYIVKDKWNEAGSIVVWAENSSKAKSQALYNDIFDGYQFIELITERTKDFDKYAETKKIPIQELLDKCWWFSCKNCGKEYLDQESIDNGEAFIIDSNYCEDDFIKGSLICDFCKEKLEGIQI